MRKRDIREYRIWKNMKSRCSAPSAKTGVYLTINVCERWRSSYEAFIEDMGYAPSKLHSIDREDNTKGYYKENCRWATAKEQSSNRGDFNIVINYKEESHTLKDWSIKLGIKYTTLYQRIYRQNLSFEDAIKFTKLYTYNGELGTLKYICSKYSNIPPNIVSSRLHRGWNLEDSLTITNKI